MVGFAESSPPSATPGAIVHRCARIAFGETRDVEQVVDLAIGQLREQSGQELPAVFANHRIFE